MSEGSTQPGKGFADHFSGHAADYAASRPTYPDALFDWLAGRCERRGLAWDVGSGNGQAAAALGRRFRRVVAAEPSLAQLRASIPARRVRRVCERAEASSLRPACADLVACAQAAHWFDQAAFHREVGRVARRGAVVALWCYGLARITPDVDNLVQAFHDDTVGAYWPPQRRHIETGYRELPLPWPELDTPGFEMSMRWTLEAFCDYLATWSAYRRYRRSRPDDPLALLRERLRPAWGEGERVVRWPLAVRAGRVG